MLIFLIILLIGVMFFGYIWWIEPAQVDIEEAAVSLPSPHLRDPVRFLFMSDIHVGRFTSLRQYRNLFGKIRKHLHDNPPVDAILLGGDLIDSNPAYLPQLQQVLRELVEWNLPVYAVLGNHDHYAYRRKVKPLVRAMEEAGVTVLRNRAVPFSAGKSRVLLIGMEELQSTDDYNRFFGHLPLDEYVRRARALDWYQQFDTVEVGLPRVMICHNPDSIYLPGEPRPAVALAGHTHGGQMAFMDWWRNWFFKPLVPCGSFQTWAGRRLIGQTTLLVSRGLAGASFPIRFLRKPHV
ncbi:metallophosphoesterase, partial [Patescibacteria group bacterium]|nr:metallophosphoesterase [Patescibacteria group bacterium]